MNVGFIYMYLGIGVCKEMFVIKIFNYLVGSKSFFVKVEIK